MDLVKLARSTKGVDLQQELDRFSFNEATALVTRSQVAGCDMTLPKRFIKVPIITSCRTREQKNMPFNCNAGREPAASYYVAGRQPCCHTCALTGHVSMQAPEWSYKVRRAQHPCYTTSNASYGIKNPKPADMPLAWNGVKGEFTKHSEGATRDKGLRCFTAMSKVHKRFDEYTHYR